MSNLHFSNYESPNIVIVPTMSFCGPPEKKQKTNAEPVAKTVPIVSVPITKPCATVHPMKNTSVAYPKENVTASLPIQENLVSMTTICTNDNNRNSSEDSELQVKKTLSWASNYLQSIGQLQPKVIKPTNSAHQKSCSNIDETRQQNLKKSLLIPALKHPVTEETHPDSLKQNTFAAGEKNKKLMNTNIVTNTDDYKNSPQDTKYPIKINLLNYKQNTDLHSDKAQIQKTTKSTPPNFEKPKTVKPPISLKSGKTDSKMFVKDSKTKKLGKFSYSSTNSHTKSRENNNLAKDKYDKNTSTSSKNICVKNNADIKKDKNKVSTESKHITECKTNDELQAWASARIHNNSESHLHFHSKDELQKWASDRIKSIPEKLARIQSNKNSQSKNNNKSDEKKDKNKVKSTESKSKKGKNPYDHESKSKITDDQKLNLKPSTKRNDDDNKNKLKSLKCSENNSPKPSEKSLLKPIKSVVQLTNKYHLDGSYKKAENNHSVEDLRTKLNVPENGHSVEDLRSKLKRKHETSQSLKRDKLIITVQNDNIEKEETSNQAKEKPKLEKKAKKYKKIKLVINVVCENFSESSESESDMNENNTEEYSVANEDLSFLDDFNVDDIVESLNAQQDKENNNNKSPSKVQESKTTVSEKLENKNIKHGDKKDKKCFNPQGRLDTETTQLNINFKQNKEEHKIVQKKVKDKNDTTFPSSKLTVLNAIQASNIPTRLEHKTIEQIQHVGHSSSILLRDDTNVPVVSPNKQENYHNSNENNILKLDLKSTGNLSQFNVASNTTMKKTLKSQNDTKVREVADTQRISNISNINTNPKPEKEVEVKDSIIIDLTQIETNIPHKTEKISLNQDIAKVQSIIQVARKHNKDTSVSAVSDLIDLTLSPDKITEINKNTATSDKKSTEHDTEAQSRKIRFEMVDNPEKHMAMPSQLQHSESKESKKTFVEIDLTESDTKTTGIKNGATNNFDVTLKFSTEQQHAGKENLVNINTNSQSTQITSEMCNKTVATTASNDNIAANGLKIVSDNKVIKNITEEATKLDIANDGISTSEEKPVKIEIVATENKHLNKSEFKEPDINEVSLNNEEIIDITRETESTETATEHHNKKNDTLTLKDISEQPTKIVSEIQNNTINKGSQQVIDKPSKGTDSDKKLIYSPTSYSIKTSVTTDTKEATTEINPEPESKPSVTSKENLSRIDNNKDKSDKLINKKTPDILALENRMLQYLRTKYSIESLIKHGKFSKIFMCKEENGRNYALKVLNKGKRIIGCRIEDMLKNLQRDIPRRNYHCVFLVNGFAMMDHWCFLMDYYPKNLQQVLTENRKCFHIDNVQVLARQLVSAVLILRNNNIMHLDIKPSHVLMNSSNDRLKLAGFDELQYLEGLSVLPNIGTVNYRPPEVIMGYPYFGKIDVWSAALVIYEMCTARQLFPGCYNNDILYKQMCTLGNLPREMVIQSVFTNYHYRGPYFARKYGPAGQQCVLIENFKKSMRLPTSLFEAYNRDWAKFQNKKQIADDSAKLWILRDLLEEMLILDPTRRTPIEFVYANSFIYETFDSCV